MSTRGKIPVRERSWMMRWYNEWRANKGWGKTERAQIDLCHFMRVLLIFGPWRWFWQSAVLWDATPFICVLILVALGSIAGAFVFATDMALTVLLWIGLFFGAGFVVLVLASLAYHWYVKDSEARKAMLERIGDGITTVVYYLFFPIWWPILHLGILTVRFSKWLAATAIVPAGQWFFTKRLFSLTVKGELLTFSPFGLAAVLAFPFWLTVMLFFHPIVVGLVFAAILLISLVVFSVVRVQRWAKAHPSSAPVEVEPKPKKEHETAQLVWSWLVAKKHRICPLIEVE